MAFDIAKIFVASGKGGDGMISFRREKYVPRGGPSGGDGGRGGDVILRGNPNLNTLNYFKQHVHFKAKPGVRGGSTRKNGANADDTIIDVPVGTVVRDAETDQVLGDIIYPDQDLKVAQGGRGGKGNARFATASNQAPRFAEKGEPGEERWLKLELKLIADVGLVGVPNAGKSTLLSVISNAKPKIADYPFTTLEPNLGVVTLNHQDLVVADIPGLIEGAHQGVGLGHSFLRHVQRTKVLVHLLDGMSDDPLADFNQINTELSLYDENIGEKPQIVVFNKIDMPDAQVMWELIKPEFEKHDVEVMTISALTHQDTEQLIYRIFQMMAEVPAEPISVITETPVYQLQEEEIPFEIDKADDVYYVTGKRIERAAQMTYWDYEEAVQRFQKILEVLGVSKALQKAGVQPGDTVFIGEYELEWSE